MSEAKVAAVSPASVEYSLEQQAARVAALDGRLAALSLGGTWQHSEALPRLEPAFWRWTDIYAGIMDAGDVLALGADTLRRSIKLVNPALIGSTRRATSRTLQMSFQLVKPGERARAHRHTAQAIRFVVQGHGAYTTVEGERMLMEPNDLILTPGWTWHDHTNLTDEDTIWLDGLDVQLATWLDAQFQVDYPSEEQPITKADGASARAMAFLRNANLEARQLREFSPYKYAWADIEPLLRELATSSNHEATDPYDGFLLEYVNPLTGGHTLPTMSCRVQLLQPGQVTAAHRHTGTTSYHVIEGSGQTWIDSNVYPWTARDCFFVPSWSTHKFQNISVEDPAILFSMSDLPALEAVRLFITEGMG